MMRPIALALGLCGLAGALAAPTIVTPAAAQRPAAPPPARARVADPVTVDRQGVMRWTANGTEVALFGVNYAAPFAYDYRALLRLGVDHKRAIDADVSHLARLGVDAYRIHVWDREVTDSLGNLLDNEHLDLFDYLLSKLAARGIKVLLTPIAWWGPGYPAPDHQSPGFANRYSKPQMLVDSVARRASVRYVAQFVRHVNPYTGLSYGEDPNIIAMEIFNEPWHDLAPPRETTRYINEMVASMRGAGYRRPIFYNISEHYTAEHGAAVCAADIQGVSAQWYPTGLVRGEALPGNPLPNVDRYPLPWRATPGCGTKAHMVYEFDGADVTVPLMYPAMARAFRGAGFQWATQFAYDPMAIAHTNTEYQTHFLNLIHTPEKAISFLIAGEVFRRTPRGFDAGTYPTSERFGDFTISYADRRSLLISDTLIAYTGTSLAQLPALASVRHVAGVGSSRAVFYTGSGAYFLDRLADGVWRLEVYPDVAPVEDPHSRGSLARSVTRVYARVNTMTITLPELGPDYVMTPLSEGTPAPRVDDRPIGRAHLVRPGVYLVSRAGAPTSAFTPGTVIAGRPLGEFHAPASDSGATIVRHAPPPSVAAGGEFSASFSIVQPERPDSVLLYARYAGWQGFRRAQRLTRVDVGFQTFLGRVSADTGRTGTLEYAVVVFTGARRAVFPSGGEATPGAWDFTGTQFWSTRVVPADAPIVLFDADRDRSRVVDPGYVPGLRSRSEVVAGSQAERNAWHFGVDAFGPTARHLAYRTMLRDGTRSRLGADVTGLRATSPETELRVRAERIDAATARLRVRLRAIGAATAPVELALIMADGSAWGGAITASSAWSEVELPLSALARVPLVLLPRPYPTFLPYSLTVASSAPLDLRQLEGLQWGLARPAGAPDDSGMRLEIEWVQLVTRP